MQVYQSRHHMAHKSRAIANQVQRKDKKKPTNLTGMPDRLKNGIESLSGFDMSDVRVHYNSDKPMQLSAHAYAQGNEIYLGPGQGRHLSHEAWHVVQQKQGRVRPTMQLQSMSINDDPGLEREADLMGAKASQLMNNQAIQLKPKKFGSSINSGQIIQRLQFVSGNPSEDPTESYIYNSNPDALNTSLSTSLADHYKKEQYIKPATIGRAINSSILNIGDLKEGMINWGNLVEVDTGGLIKKSQWKFGIKISPRSDPNNKLIEMEGPEMEINQTKGRANEDETTKSNSKKLSLKGGNQGGELGSTKTNRVKNERTEGAALKYQSRFSYVTYDADLCMTFLRGWTKGNKIKEKVKNLTIKADDYEEGRPFLRNEKIGLYYKASKELISK